MVIPLMGLYHPRGENLYIFRRYVTDLSVTPRGDGADTCGKKTVGSAKNPDASCPCSGQLA